MDINGPNALLKDVFSAAMVMGSISFTLEFSGILVSLVFSMLKRLTLDNEKEGLVSPMALFLELGVRLFLAITVVYSVIFLYFMSFDMFSGTTIPELELLAP